MIRKGYLQGQFIGEENFRWLLVDEFHLSVDDLTTDPCQTEDRELFLL